MWGLLFKFEIDDMCEVLVLVVIEKLLQVGVIVKVFDLVVMEEMECCIGKQVIYCKDMYEVVIDVDVIVLMMEWKQFCMLSWVIICKVMKNFVVVDGCNIYDGEELKELGFIYFCIG